MNVIWSLPLAVACFLMPFQASAQTAQDTVVFILYGVQDGAPQYQLSANFSRDSLQMQKQLQATWKRDDNG